MSRPKHAAVKACGLGLEKAASGGRRCILAQRVIERETATGTVHNSHSIWALSSGFRRNRSPRAVSFRKAFC